MKAIIMAGGEGSRLRPLTCDCPKPMLPLMGRPLMDYALQLLRRHGVNDIAATLAYLPDSITNHFGDQLRFYTEKTPLGTAGSVKQASDFLDERFIVLSGDGITDIDLTAALRFHAERGALATLVLKKHPCPQEYGMVVTSPDGRIRSFHEKPGRSDVYSDQINTGIYILEPELLECIPENRPYDFGHDLFPALAADGLPIYGYSAPGYWCDVGDVGAYLRVHRDALDGKIKLDGLAPSTHGAILEPGCSIEGPVYIAPGAHIAAGARIHAYCAIGEGCHVEGGADLKRSLLLPGARIGASAQLRSCIIGAGAAVEAGARLFEESVVGSRSLVGECATLPPGVKLWPEKNLSGGERAEENIVWGSRREQRFLAGALMLESPAQATRAAQACAVEIPSRELLIGRSPSAVAEALSHAAAAGIMAQGVQILDAGICTLPQLRHSQISLRADAALLVLEDRIIPLAARGVPLTEKQQRAIRKLLDRQDFPTPFSRITRPAACAGPTDAHYAASTAAAFRADPRCAPPVFLHAHTQHQRRQAEHILIRAGLQLRTACSLEPLQREAGETGIELSPSGEQALFSDDGGSLDEIQRQLACAWTALEHGEGRLILPNRATRAIDELAARYGAHCLYLSGEDALWMNALAEKAPLQFRLQFDGLYFALAFLSLLADKGLSLDQWKRRMPMVCRSLGSVQVPHRESGRLLHALAERFPESELGGGVRLKREGSWAFLNPDEGGSHLSIIAEGADMESARELCNFCSREIERLLGQKQD